MNLKDTFVDILGCHRDVLITFLHLIHVTVRLTVAGHQSVDTETVVVTAVRDAPEVTSRGVPFGFHLLVVFNDRLVDKVPDAAALKLRIFLEDINIILQSAAAVTHGVTVFDHDERTVFLVEMVFCKLLQIVDAGIHQSDVVGVVVVDGAFADDRPRVAFLHPVVAIFGADAVAAFVAYRPHYDRRMVLVALDHILTPI